MRIARNGLVRGEGRAADGAAEYELMKNNLTHPFGHTFLFKIY